MDVIETVHGIYIGTQRLDALDGETARRTVKGLVDVGYSFTLSLLYTHHTEGLKVVTPGATVVLLFTVDRFSHWSSVTNTTLI